jgi:hypothetical protein
LLAGMARRIGALFPCILDRIDAGLEDGAIEGHLPDGSSKPWSAAAFQARGVVHVHNWRALTRLVRGGSIGWYEGWIAGEWSSPDLVPIFDLFMRNRTPWAASGGRRASPALRGASRNGSTATPASMRATISRRIMIWAMISTRMARCDDDLFECGFCETPAGRRRWRQRKRRKIDLILDRLS